MIFATVGAQMPFDRMIRTIDEWAGQRGREDVFAQTNEADYRPRHVEWVKSLEPSEFRKRFQAADVVVAHAGMGSIITALELGKPLLVVPRLARFGETRNDHQVATAEHFHKLGYVEVAHDDAELIRKLDHLEDLVGRRVVGNQASEELITALRSFVSDVGEG